MRVQPYGLALTDVRSALHCCHVQLSLRLLVWDLCGKQAPALIKMEHTPVKAWNASAFSTLALACAHISHVPSKPEAAHQSLPAMAVNRAAAAGSTCAGQACNGFCWYAINLWTSAGSRGPWDLDTTQQVTILHILTPDQVQQCHAWPPSIDSLHCMQPPATKHPCRWPAAAEPKRWRRPLAAIGRRDRSRKPLTTDSIPGHASQRRVAVSHDVRLHQGSRFDG